MAYTTPDAVRLALAPGQEDGSGTTGGTNTAADESDATLLVHIRTAESRVNRYLRARYTVPFSEPVPGDVTDLVTAIAAFEATLGYRRGAPLLPTDPVMLRYSAAMQSLRDLSTGLAVLAAPGASDESTGDDGGIVINPRGVDLLDGAEVASYRTVQYRGW